MYLARRHRMEGRRAEMVGAIPGDIRMHAKPVGRGYVILESRTPAIPGATATGIRAAADASCTPTNSTTRVSGLPADTRYAYARCGAATASTAA
jgi:cobyrinic acid a,c-diamide synthase